MNEAPRKDPEDPSADKGGQPWLLYAIITSIAAGVLVGGFFGDTIWMATGGPSTRLERLEKIAAQKQRFADEYTAEAEALRAEARESDSRSERESRLEAATKREAEARRLAGHIPEVQTEIVREKQRVELAEQRGGTTAYRVAGAAGRIIQFFGDIFIQVLKLLVIPLVLTSMIVGITSLGDVRKLGQLGGVTIGYYTVTCAVAVLIGIGLVVAIAPGESANDTFSYVTETAEQREGVSPLEMLLEVVRGREGEPGSGMFPSNIFEAASNTNVLALIVFALLFGGCLTTVGDRGRTVIEFFQGANEAVMRMVHLVMYFAPVGIFGLVAWNIIKNGGGEGFAAEAAKLLLYMVTVILGLAVHAVVLMAIYFAATRRNPLTYSLGLAQALLTSVTTASSSATLPVTMECVEENNGVSNRAAGFVLPLGATVNMDGTALYEAVAVIFIAQSTGVELSLGQLIIVFLTATLAAIGAAGIPEAGLVTMVIVLQAVGLPLTGIGTILAVDWFLDRLRTTVNVYGDAIGAGLVDHWVIQPSEPSTGDANPPAEST